MEQTYKSSFLFVLAFLLKLLGAFSCYFAPLLGFFGTTRSCVALFGLRTALSVVMGSFSWYLPTLAGSLVLSTQSRIYSVLIPLVCMGLFLLHPVGSSSWLYTVYWLIPIGLSFVPQPSIFTRALMSTYTTHAVGSVIWLYAQVTTSTYWHALIAQVWFERLQYALILTGSYCVIIYCSKLLRKVDNVKTSYPLSSPALRTSYS